MPAGSFISKSTGLHHLQKKQQCNPKMAELETFQPLAMSGNAVHKVYDQNWWQRTALTESNMQVWLTADSEKQALTPVTNGPIPLLQQLPQDTSRDMLWIFFLVHKIHLYWLCKLLPTLQNTCKALNPIAAPESEFSTSCQTLSDMFYLYKLSSKEVLIEYERSVCF